MNNNSIIGTVPAAGSLHSVPGFDPLRYLRKTTNALGEPVLRLDLRYKKLWFRLACPNGRILLKPLRITDQMSIMEARVFFDRSDETPVSSFTATKTVGESRSYIRDAQDEALNEALDNAGFGIQLCDVAEASGSDYGSDIPASHTETRTGKPQTVSSPQTNTAPVETAGPVAASAQMHQKQANAAVQQQRTAVVETVETKPPMSSNEKESQQLPAGKTQNHQSAVQKSQNLPQNDSDATPKPQPAEQNTAPKEVVDLLAQMAKHNAQPGEPPAPAEEAAVNDSPAAPGFPEDMPVEEICKRMTLEEARAVVVPTGTCKGWTLAQVAEKRRPSLKFYMYSTGVVNNVVKAAATLLWNDVEMQKAG